jgi:hypothetical protein
MVRTIDELGSNYLGLRTSMAYTKVIVCLANSRKPSGRCVAGREITASGFGGWIRPVSARSTQEISEHERSYRDGRDPSLLDVIEIPVITPQPHHHQAENHLIDSTQYWVFKDRASWSQLQAAVEHVAGPLWINDSSSSHGLNDRVAENRARTLACSLFLVRPDDLVLHVATEGGEFAPARRRVRASFRLVDHDYILSVSDPVIESHFLRQPNGDYPVSDARICVSLAEPFHGYAYKLVASVITRERAGT